MYAYHKGFVDFFKNLSKKGFEWKIVEYIFTTQRYITYIMAVQCSHARTLSWHLIT